MVQTRMRITPRQVQILVIRGMGYNEQEMATLLGIHPQSARNEQLAIYRALGVYNITAAVCAVAELGLLKQFRDVMRDAGDPRDPEVQLRVYKEWLAQRQTAT